MAYPYNYNTNTYSRAYTNTSYGDGYGDRGGSYYNSDYSSRCVNTKPLISNRDPVVVEEKDLTSLEAKYAKRQYELTKETNDLAEIYKTKKNELEKEYENKKVELENEFNISIEEYNQKLIDLNKTVGSTLSHGRIILNVGGRLYETTIETIESIPFFQCLFTRWTSNNTHTATATTVAGTAIGNTAEITHSSQLPLVDNKYHLFIDRDPDAFYYILNYLRTGVIPYKNKMSEYLYDILLADLVFYGLDDLKEHLLENKNTSVRLRKTMNY